jgi:HEAT repeat protein
MTSLHTLAVVLALAGPVAPTGGDASPAGAQDLARLRELLYSRQEPQEQSQAALLLVQDPSPEAAELVRASLRRWDRPDVFQALAAAIRLRRDPRFVNPLLQALACEQPAIRQAAIDTLARLDPVATSRRLLALAEDATAPPAARQAAVVALGKAIHKSSIVPLLSLLTSDTPAIRQAAALALEELTGYSYGTDALAWQSWWLLHKDLAEDEWLAARTAYFADRARRLRDDLQRAEAHLVEVHQALYAKIPPADRVSHLHGLVQSDYPGVRSQAIAWIVELLPEAERAEQQLLADLLLRLSEDGVEPVQRQAVLALEKVNDPRAFERLLVLLQTGTVSVRAAAARSLGRCRGGRDRADANARAVAALEQALGDPSLAVVAEAAESLGSMKTPAAAPILTGLLRHPSDPVRQAAARALEQAATPVVLSDLTVGLDDAVAGVRFSLVGALGRIGAAASDPQRAEIRKRLETILLKDGDPGVRSRAATVLGDLGTAADLPFLWQRVTAVEDNRVQVKAWWAMIEILSRSESWPLVHQWDQKLGAQGETARRVELLTEIRTRWSKQESTRPHLDALTASLVQAQLAQRKWNLAMPFAVDLAKRAPTEAELKGRLRWLLIAGTQAVEDKKPQDALQMLKEIEDLLTRSRELAPEFDALRQRAQQAADRS